MSEYCCEELKFHINSESLPVVYIPKFREYGINYSNSSLAFQEIYFCPWCGKKFPGSVRDEWYDIIDELGLDPDDDKLPIEFNSEKWWIDKGL